MTLASFILKGYNSPTTCRFEPLGSNHFVRAAMVFLSHAMATNGIEQKLEEHCSSMFTSSSTMTCGIALKHTPGVCLCECIGCNCRGINPSQSLCLPLPALQLPWGDISPPGHTQRVILLPLVTKADLTRCLFCSVLMSTCIFQIKHATVFHWASGTFSHFFFESQINIYIYIFFFSPYWLSYVPLLFWRET